ncbi:succinylglutamate desuccinylase/aspartoacylase family protein [Phaeovulum sp.]|uniref:succinylglutamate desuccinylase/aspartoacylase family protein n=1 Tax=Phaeovulum sp. TaxID=2934796 RepID=UPI00356280C2
MKTETVPLTSASPGTSRTLTRHVWGGGGQRPKIYLQGALHADEMPGAIALWHLMDLLDVAEAEGRVVGEVSVVPFANPIGLTQWVQNKPQGRQDLESMRNFNRHYPDLAALVGDGLEGKLGDEAEENARVIRAAFAAALAAETPKSEAEEMRIRLMQWSHDADIVLDLHCDHVALMHFYASSARPEVTELLGRATGAKLALIEDISGGNAFDEAHTAPWAALRKRYDARFPIPAACFSTTLEYRGQNDVDDTVAQADAAKLMTFLGAVGAVSGEPAPAYPPALQRPLGGAGEAFAPQGGIVTWVRAPGAEVSAGETIAWVSDPVARRRMAVVAPATGLLFRRELWTHCLAGQSLCNVAGDTILRRGNLLSD